MDAQQALADLTEISSQIRAAVVFDDKGKVAGSTLEDAARAEELARNAAELLAVADGVKTGDGGELTQLEAATEEGSVFVVRDGPTRIAATTGIDPTVGLVFYDLKSALRNLETASAPAAKRAPAKRPAAAKKPAAKKPESPSATTKKQAAKRPVRASGPGEGASGEPGGSPAPSQAARKPAARKKKDDAS
jgi:predicted regulator of Ras-like GTPase activity (Roadblock/LC7/MglB family)